MILAALWNHVISLPAVPLGAALVIWSRPLSGVYAAIYRAPAPGA